MLRIPVYVKERDDKRNIMKQIGIDNGYKRKLLLNYEKNKT